VYIKICARLNFENFLNLTMNSVATVTGLVRFDRVISNRSHGHKPMYNGFDVRDLDIPVLVLSLLWVLPLFSKHTGLLQLSN
jgi:hypothetical protein